MATQSIPIGLTVTLTQNVIYAMPSKPVIVTCSAACETSTDQSVWTAIATGAFSTAKFIRSAGVNTVVTLADAKGLIQSGSGGSGSGGSGWNTIFKGTDETRTVGTAASLADDPVLKFPVVAGKGYAFRCFLLSNIAEGSVAAMHNLTNGTVINLTSWFLKVFGSRYLADQTGGSPSNNYIRANTAGLPQLIDTNGYMNLAGVASQATTNILTVEGAIRPTQSGNFAVRWAPGNNGFPMILRAESWLEWKEV